MKIANFNFVFLIMLIVPLAFAQDISVCSNLNSANTVYDLTTNVSSAGSCMNITADNITLDCHGFTMNYSKSLAGYGINNSDGYNYTTIRNCNIVQETSESSMGISMANGASNNKIYNNNISINGANSMGINIQGSYSEEGEIFSYSHDNNVSDNALYGNGIALNSSYGIITNVCNEDLIYHNNISYFYYGLAIGSQNSSISENRVRIKYSGFYDLGINNSNVSGNIINITSDDPYGNCQGLHLHYSNITFSGNYIEINDCNNSKGLMADDYDIKEIVFKNNTFIIRNSSHSNALRLNTGFSNSSLYDNVIYIQGENSVGINLSDAYNNDFYNSSITSVNGYSILLGNSSAESSPRNNTIWNCFLNGSSFPVGFEAGFPPGSAGTNYWNTSNQTGTRIFGSGNRISGNYYTNSTGDGFSDICDDTDTDGFCDSDYNVSTNSICSGASCGNNTDYMALSSKYSASEVFGNLNVSLTWPTSKLNVIQNRTFRINASAMCSGGSYCGNVTGTARYNLSSSIDTDVNTSDGDKPLFTLSGNPQECGVMNQDDTCNLSWLVNATGDIGEVHAIAVLFESNETSVEDNQTESKEVEIIECTTDVTISFLGILFGNETNPLVPNSFGNDAVNNSLDFYNITVNSGSCVLDIYGNASSMVSDTSIQEIGSGNMSFNNLSNDYESSSRFSTEYQMIFSSIVEGITKTLWFWLDMPPVYYGNYTGNLTIASVKQGESPV